MLPNASVKVSFSCVSRISKKSISFSRHSSRPVHSSRNDHRCIMTARRDRRGTQELVIKRNDVRFLERRFRGERRLPEKFNVPRALEKKGGVLRHRNSIRLAASKFNGPRRCNFALERCHDASGVGRVRCRKGTTRTLRALLYPKG